jgi:DNA (cytosine-5)-methyltransferase 1
MKLLDLFCKAGGCTRGYQLAGFYVVGVDIEPQPRYVGDEFIQGEALAYVAAHGHEYDLIHASPPCEGYSKAALQWRMKGKVYPDLVAETRQALQKTGKPYVIENVPEAPLINPVCLNGAVFGRRVHRPRLFECSFDLPFFLQPIPPKPVKMGRPVKEGDIVQPVGHFSGVAYARKEMECEWMNIEELAHAIPPAYTKWIGEQFLAQQVAA